MDKNVLDLGSEIIFGDRGCLKREDDTTYLLCMEANDEAVMKKRSFNHLRAHLRVIGAS